MIFQLKRWKNSGFSAVFPLFAGLPALGIAIGQEPAERPRRLVQPTAKSVRWRPPELEWILKWGPIFFVYIYIYIFIMYTYIGTYVYNINTGDGERERV